VRTINNVAPKHIDLMLSSNIENMCIPNQDSHQRSCRLIHEQRGLSVLYSMLFSFDPSVVF
jgi:hypothetical protein